MPDRDLTASKSMANSRYLQQEAVKRPEAQPTGGLNEGQAKTGDDELKETFQDFVGQTLFSQMIKAARTTQQPAPYFNGGRAEEIFQGQLDQVLSEKMSDASAEKIAGPMYELFMLRRQS